MSQFFSSLESLNSCSFPVNEIIEILEESIKAADPYLTTVNNLEKVNNFLKIGNANMQVYSDTKVVVIGIGKASMAMTSAVIDVLEDSLTQGICITKQIFNFKNWSDKVQVIQSGHPVPDERSVLSVKRIHDMVTDLTSKDIVIFLVSGGGSSLVCLPNTGISLSAIQTVTEKLLITGASINEMNTVRKHLDSFKGGGFIRMVYPARTAALVISDVINSPLDVIASGPAIPDPTTFEESIEILVKYVNKNDIPLEIINYFQQGKKGLKVESVKPGEFADYEILHTIIASNKISSQSACKIAEKLGYSTKLLTNELSGEAINASQYLIKQIKAQKKLNSKQMWIAGGETVVNVIGNGIGGRNLEVALGTVEQLAGIDNSLLITFATDGEDGPTDAAGAFVTGQTLTKSVEKEINIREYINNNDSYSFFKKVEGLIQTGSTGTNVNDLNFIFKFK